MKRALAIGGAGLLGVLALAVVALRFVPQELLNDLYNDTLNDPTDLHARLEAAHEGGGPCLRYEWLRQGPRPAGLDELGDRLHDLGFTSEQVSGVVGQFLAWSDEREAPFHQEDASTEMVRALSGGKPLAGLVLWLNQERLRGLLEPDVSSYKADGALAFSALSPELRVALRRAWEVRPEAFVVGNLVQVVNHLRQREVGDRLDALTSALIRHVQSEEGRAGGEVDLSAVAQAAGVPASDYFGLPFVLEQRGDVLRLSSADGLMSREFSRLPPPSPTNESDRAAAETCAAAPVPVTLLRSEVDAALADMETLSRQARMVPAFEQGQVVGFKVFGIDTGSFHARLGLCNGDVVRRVNDLPLTSPDEALVAYATVRSAKRVRLAVVRRGEAHELRVSIR